MKFEEMKKPEGRCVTSTTFEDFLRRKSMNYLDPDPTNRTKTQYPIIKYGETRMRTRIHKKLRVDT